MPEWDTLVAGREQTAPAGVDVAQVFAASYRKLVVQLYGIVGNASEAEDLVQEAFVRVAGRFRHLRVPDAFDAYLRRTIVNLSTSQLRRAKLERAYAVRHATEPSVVAEPGDPAVRDELWQALHTLPERQRAAIVLRFYEDLSEQQSAEILRCSPGALNQLVVRGMATLREQIGDSER
jgi:RNA polymerase sigma-70 factor (sigma-E family)